MPKYKVLIERTTELVETAEVEVEADDLGAAKKAAAILSGDDIPDDEWGTSSADCTEWKVLSVKQDKDETPA